MRRRRWGGKSGLIQTSASIRSHAPSPIVRWRKVTDLASAAAFWAAALAVLGVVAELSIQDVWPAGLETDAVHSAEALLFTGKRARLPNPLVITIDGARAVLRRHTKEYDEFYELLQKGRSAERLERAGAETGLAGAQACGELIVPGLLRASHFQILRSEKNPDYYWLRLPGLKIPGKVFPVLTVDPQVVAFIRATADGRRK